MSRIHCINQWDNESKHIYLPDGIVGALYAGECRYGAGESYVLYPAESVLNEQCQMYESLGPAEQKTVSD